MNIWSNPGCKVRFVRPDAGYPCDIEVATENLELNSIYIADEINVGDFRTLITLRGLPGLEFNVCHFENVDPVDPEAAELNEKIWLKNRGLV
tara:strand:+ start:344 stop:619 length:276 start_codon:yes stop_codon:yes gene_type:complete